MIFLMVTQSIVTLAAVGAIVVVIRSSKDERSRLEDRLMAICHPVAQTQVMSERTGPTGLVNYVDEEPYSAKLEMSNANSST